MRPRSLELKNFGPFIEEKIDFGQLTEASLFLISGNTGTGKTTIFDGMTYALFGETSGRLRSGKEMRSTFASPEAETAVVFTFEHQDMIYQILRKPEQVLRKKRGQGERTQSARVELTVLRPDGQEIGQFSKQREVEEQIKELLHLDARQFSQIVLLPQGDFRTFLIANSKDKESVLRHLFGTQMFQNFAEKLKERLKAENKDLEHSNTRLEMLKEQFRWLDEGLAIDSYQEFIMQGEKQLQRQQQNVLAAEQHLYRLEQLQKSAETAFYEAKDQVAAFEERDRLLLEQNKLAAQTAAMTEQRNQVAVLEWAEKQRSLIEKLDEQMLLEKELRQKQQTTKVAIKENEAALADIEKQHQQWQSQAPKFAGWQAQLTEITRKIPLLKELKDYYEQQQQLLKTEQKNRNVQNELTQRTEEIQQNMLNCQNLIQRAAEFQKEQTFILEMRQELKELQQYQNEWNRLNSDLQIKEQKLGKSIEQITEIQQQQQQISAKLQEMKSEWAKQQIARLSLMLEPGSPCPVCGSLEHPAAHEWTAEYDLQAIHQSEAEMEKLENQVVQLKEKQAEVLTEQSFLKEQVADIQVKSATVAAAQTAAFTNFKAAIYQKKELQYETLPDYQEYLAEFQQKVAEELATIQSASSKLKKLQEQDDLLQQQVIEIQQQEQALAVELAQLEGAINHFIKQGIQGEAADLEHEKIQLSQQVDAYQREEKYLLEEKQTSQQQKLVLSEQMRQITAELDKVQLNLKNQQAKVAEQLESAKTSLTLAELRGFLGDTAQISEMRQKLADYEMKKTVNQERLAPVNQQLQGLEKPELVDYGRALSEAQQAVKQYQGSHFQEKQSLDHNQKNYTEFIKLYQKNQEQLELLNQLAELSQVINGDNSQKTSLERYVLRTYLREVLQVANQHLDQLTRNRYQFELSKEIGSYRNQTGLEINVYDDDAGSSRSVHTLSGGESFIAALALALALAEVIQNQAGGISIEALFIDEGFGSLDEDSLNMAMEALETIESEGRMIGVISHVRELKERIPQQILVLGSGTGQSQIQYK